MSKPTPCVIPARRDYRPVHAVIAELPFVASPRFYRKHGSRRCGNLWRVPRTSDYQLARAVGQQYAAHFTQYLKDNPLMVGYNLLGRIATDMDFHDASAARGYWIGFFSYLEHLLYTQAAQCEVFADLEQFTCAEGLTAAGV